MQNIILLFMKERENMGIIQKFKCPSCEMSWEVFLGHGMGHALIENSCRHSGRAIPRI